MKLRAYDSDDFEGLYRVEEQCFEVPLRFDREYMQELLGRKGSSSFVVEARKVIVGFGIVSLYKKADLISGYIETIEVLEEYRGRGFARKLLEQLEAAARGADARRMLLHVDCMNEPAIRLYEKNGYNKIGEKEDFYPNGHVAFIYRKLLAAR